MQEREDFIDISKEEPDIVTVNYLKSNQFRVFHADGIWGCLTPNLDIQIAFWNERFSIPEQVMYRNNPEGNIEEIKEKTIAGESTIIRELEICTIIDVETAEMLVEWLQGKIHELYKFEQLEEVVEDDEDNGDEKAN